MPDLPAQVGELAPRDPLEPVGDERVLELGELRVELSASAYPPVSGAGSPVSAARVRRSRSAMNPNRCRYGSSGKRRRSCRSISGSASASRASRDAERPRHAVARLRRRDRLHQPGRDRLVAAEHVVGLDRAASLVTSAVTPGLPSRSPPIQVPQRRNGRARGGRVPVRPRRSRRRPPRRARRVEGASSAR